MRSARVEFPLIRHNALLVRARLMQGRVLALHVRWHQTGDVRYGRAVLNHVREIGCWRYWSWITWRRRDPRPDAIFDLSYGENSATLAMAYDLLHGTLTPAEKRLFHAIALNRSFCSFLHHTAPDQQASWFCKPDTNWNAVCAGGAGMLALALYDELPVAQRVLDRVECSISQFFRHLDTTGGGWPEGIGYWNYGMRYGFMYLLSWERATGCIHPLLRSKNVRRTLDFPLDFSPYGVPCSFGDSNRWFPSPFHFAIAERLHRTGILAELNWRFERCRKPVPDIGEAALLLLFHSRRDYRLSPPRKHFVRLYRGLDWGILADQMPTPGLYLSIRGGTTKVPHAHRDLLSFHCLVLDEALITNIGEAEYLDSTFGPRRFELFEMGPASKNTILINGVGIAEDSSVETRQVRLPGARGFRIVATEAMGRMYDGSAARFCARLALMLEAPAVLIVGRCDLPAFGRVESRMHTYAAVNVSADGSVLLRGEHNALRIAYASSAPARLWHAQTSPTTPAEGARVLRWCTEGLHRSVTMAALLVPGRGKAKVRIEECDRRIHLVTDYGGRRAEWTFNVWLVPTKS
ncbi:MAG: heparinase II/III domain-containing protein [Kiritimatiellia bacterium]